MRFALDKPEVLRFLEQNLPESYSVVHRDTCVVVYKDVKTFNPHVYYIVCEKRTMGGIKYIDSAIIDFKRKEIKIIDPEIKKYVGGFIE